MQCLRSALVLGMVAGMVGWNTGCDRDSSSRNAAPKPRVALLMKARTNPFFAKMEDGAREAADKVNVELEVLAIDKETDAERQAAHVETVISKGVRAIIIAPADSKAIIAPLLQAQAQGIKIINVDNRIATEEARKAGLKIETFIGPDNAEGARKSTTAMLEAIGGEGEIVMLEGIRGVDNAEARKRGFLEAVRQAGDKVKVVAMDSAEWAMEPAQKKMEGFLTTYPNLKGVFAANDMMALGVMAAIPPEKKGQIVVAGYDNLRAARDAIKAGSMLVTVDQHPDRMGALGVESAVKVIRGEAVEAEIVIPTDLVTKTDIE